MNGNSKNISENLIKLRKTNKLTQQEEAKIFGYTDKAISRWEKGESIPDMDTLLVICEYYGVDLNYLVSKNEVTPVKKEDEEEQKWLGKRGMKVAVVLLFAMFAFTLAIFFFIINLVGNDHIARWTFFIWASSASFFIASILSMRWWKSIISAILWSLTMWITFTGVFFELLPTIPNAWLLFIAGVPIQGIIVIISYLSKDSKKSHSS